MSLFQWENFSQLQVYPKLSFFQNKNLSPGFNPTGPTGPIDLNQYRGSTGPQGPTGATGALDGGIGGFGGIGGPGGPGATGPIVIINGVSTQLIGPQGNTGPRGATGPSGPILYCLPTPAQVSFYDPNGGIPVQIGGIPSRYFGISPGVYYQLFSPAGSTTATTFSAPNGSGIQTITIGALNGLQKNFVVSISGGTSTTVKIITAFSAPISYSQTATFNSTTGIYAGHTLIVTNASNSTNNGTFIIRSVSGNSVTYTNPDGGVASTTVQTATATYYNNRLSNAKVLSIIGANTFTIYNPSGSAASGQSAPVSWTTIHFQLVDDTFNIVGGPTPSVYYSDLLDGIPVGSVQINSMLAPDIYGNQVINASGIFRLKVNDTIGISGVIDEENQPIEVNIIEAKVISIFENTFTIYNPTGVAAPSQSAAFAAISGGGISGTYYNTSNFSIEGPAHLYLLGINKNILAEFYSKNTCDIARTDNSGFLPPLESTALIRFFLGGLDGNSADNYYIVDKTGAFAYSPAGGNQPELGYNNGTFPYGIASSSTGFSWIITGIFSTTASGEYKLKRANSYLDAGNYYYLVNAAGVIEQRTAGNNLVVYWNGTTAFPFTSYAALEITPSSVYTDINYTIIGLFIDIAVGSYYLKQPIIGTYGNANYYNIVDQSFNVIQDPYTGNTDPVIILYSGSLSNTNFTSFPAISTTNNGIRYTITGFYQYYATGTYYIQQVSNTSIIYNLVTSDGTTVNDPGTNNTSIVTIEWDGTGDFNLSRYAYSGYKQILYLIVGVYSVSAYGLYTVKQTIVNNAPSTIHNLIDVNGDIVLDGSSNPVLINWTGGVVPRSVNSTTNTTIKYVVTGIFSIVQSTYKIQLVTGGIYNLVTLNGDTVLDPGTNSTSIVTIGWNGTDPFPLITIASSSYSYIKYYISGLYTVVSPIIPTGPTGPTAGSTGPLITDGFDFGSMYTTETYVPYTGPTGPYTGPTTIGPPGASGPDAASPAITNTVGGSVTTLIGGQQMLAASTSVNGYTILFQST